MNLDTDRSTNIERLCMESENTAAIYVLWIVVYPQEKELACVGFEARIFSNIITHVCRPLA